MLSYNKLICILNIRCICLLAIIQENTATFLEIVNTELHRTGLSSFVKIEVDAEW